MAKVHIFLTDGFEEIEGLMVVDLLRRAGITINMVSVTDSLYITGSHGIQVKADILFDDINENVDMLILPGGPGTKNLGGHKGLVKLLLRYNLENKMIAAICAAPGVLGQNGILKDKKATCFPGHEAELKGAVYSNEKVACDKNIITSKGLGTALDFALAIIEHFDGADAANNIQKSVQYK